MAQVGEFNRQGTDKTGYREPGSPIQRIRFTGLSVIERIYPAFIEFSLAVSSTAPENQQVANSLSSIGSAQRKPRYS